MWNETPEVVAVREALGLFSATLVVVCPADGLIPPASKSNSGLLLVFDTVAVFDPHPNRTVSSPLERDTMTQDPSDGLCRWFVDDTAEVQPNSYPKGFDITVGGRLTCRFDWVDDRAAVLNGLRWMFSSDVRRTGRELPLSALGGILYPQATQRLKSLIKTVDGADAAPVYDGREFVVADIDGAIVTNKRLFFATSVVLLSAIEFMKLQPGHLVVVISEYTRIKIQCSYFRQALLLRKWLLSVLDDNSSIKMNDQPRLLTMMALHRQFCVVDVNADGHLTKEEFCGIVSPIFANSMFADCFFRVMDSDNSGAISFSEFAAGLMDLLDDDLETRIRFTFALFDVNGDGGIEREEMINVLRSLQHTGDVIMVADEAELHQACEILFEHLDVDGDGQITMEEYMAGFSKPEVYQLLCRLGLAGDRSLRRHRELSVALVAPSTEAWSLVSRVMHSLRIFVDQIHLTEVSGECFIPSDAVLGAAAAGGGVRLYAADTFRMLQGLWGIGATTLEDSLGVDNVAASLLLGSPRLPKVESTTPPTLIAFDGSFSIFHVPHERFKRLLRFLPEYAAYMTRCPNSLLSRIAGMLTITDDATEVHMLVVYQHVECINPAFRADLPTVDEKFKLAVDAGWMSPILGQVESDIALAARWDVPVSMTITSAAPFADFATVENPTVLTRTAISERNKQARKTVGKTKKSGGGCCGGGSAVRNEAEQSRVPRVDRVLKAPDIRPLAASHKALGSVTSNEHAVQFQLTLLPDCDTVTRKQYAPKGAAGASGAKNPPPPTSTTTMAEATGVVLPTHREVLRSFLVHVREVLSEELSEPVISQQCVAFDVIVYNGNQGTLTLDKGSRMLFLTSQGAVMLSLSLRMSYGLGTIRTKFARADDRRKLVIRSEPNDAANHFRVSKLVRFESIEDLEHLTSDVFRSTGTSNTSGMQTGVNRVAVIHWNVGGANPPEELPSLTECVDEHTSIVVVSASQCVFQAPGRSVTLSCEEDWTRRVVHQLGAEFHAYHVVSCGATRLIIACRGDVGAQISQLESFKHSLVSDQGRAAGTAVCVSLLLQNTPICFLGLEMKAGATPATNAMRMEETFRVFSDALGQPVDLLNSHYMTFLFGDFNWGTTIGATEAVECACHGDLAKLYRQDHLQHERRMNGSMVGFDEPQPEFPPTSTFVRGVSTGNGKRIYDEFYRHPASWSSRILSRTLGHPLDKPVRVGYGSVGGILTSPHNAVYSLFDVPVRHQYVLQNVLHQATKCSKLVISDLRCTGLAAEDLNGTSDPVIKFDCPFALRPEEDITPVIPATLNPVWMDTFSVLLEGVEASLLMAAYLTFIIVDEDSRGLGDSLGQAVVPLSVLDADKGASRKRQIELPVLRHGRCCGMLYCAIRLITTS